MQQQTLRFNQIWDIHKTHLKSFIKTKINEEYIVDDILQEISIKLHDNLNRKTVIQNHKAWLFQVARNTIADYYRKQTKYSETNTIQLEANTNSDVCVCDLSGFIIKTYLPEKYSKPLYLSDIEQKPQQEIANSLNLSLAATKSRIQRGRVKLKELVNQCVDISFNNKGQIADFQLKVDCNLPIELKNEMDRLNLVL